MWPLILSLTNPTSIGTVRLVVYCRWIWISLSCSGHSAWTSFPVIPLTRTWLLRRWRQCFSLWKCVQTLWFFIHFGFSKDVSSSSAPSHLPLPLTLRPHYAGSDRSNHVSQSHMSSFFFDTALLSPLLGILEWECMHHRRSISSDRNAAPRLGEIEGWEERERWREKERKRRKGRERERAGQWLVDILPGPKPQTDREKERDREGEEWERMRVKGRKQAPFYFWEATLVNIYFLSNQPLWGIQQAYKFLYPFPLERKLFDK